MYGNYMFSVTFGEGTDGDTLLTVLGGLEGYNLRVRFGGRDVDIRLDEVKWYPERSAWGFVYRELDEVTDEPLSDTLFVTLAEVSHIYIY